MSMIEIGNIYSDDWFGKNISLSVSNYDFFFFF